MTARPGTHAAGWLRRLIAPRYLRWSLVELCRRTTLEGWEHLQVAEEAGRGVVLIALAGTPWPVAARAIAAWAGPLHLALPPGERDRRLAWLACARGGPSLRLAADSEAIRRALASGEKLLMATEAGIASQAPDSLARVPHVQVTVERTRHGRYRLILSRPPEVE